MISGMIVSSFNVKSVMVVRRISIPVVALWYRALGAGNLLQCKPSWEVRSGGSQWSQY